MLQKGWVYDIYIYRIQYIYILIHILFILYDMIWYYMIWYDIILLYFILYYGILYDMILNYIILYCIVLYYIKLNYIILYSYNKQLLFFFWGYLEGNVWIYWLATNAELRCFLFLGTVVVVAVVVVVWGIQQFVYIYTHHTYMQF